MIVAKVRSFLGLTSYYYQFVEGFSKIVGPLYNLIEKGISFMWDEKYE